MATQVLTSEGLAEFYTTGKVPERKDEGVKPADKKETEPAVVSDAPKGETKDDDEGLTEAERSEFSEKIRKKISAKHRALKQAEAFADHQSKERQAAERKASDLAKEIAELKGKVSAIPDSKDGPQRKDFDNDADWWDAKIDWKAEQKAEAKFTKLETEREQKRIQAEKSARIEQFASTVDDYEDVVSSLSDKPIHQAVIDYLSEAEHGPAVIYYLGKHSDEWDRIAKMRPVLAVAEVGKIEAKLERKAEKTAATAEPKADAVESFKTPISRAPAPLRTLDESASPLQKDPSKMDVDELRAYNRNQRLTQARR